MIIGTYRIRALQFKGIWTRLKLKLSIYEPWELEAQKLGARSSPEWKRSMKTRHLDKKKSLIYQLVLISGPHGQVQRAVSAESRCVAYRGTFNKTLQLCEHARLQVRCLRGYS